MSVVYLGVTHEERQAIYDFLDFWNAGIEAEEFDKLCSALEEKGIIRLLEEIISL